MPAVCSGGILIGLKATRRLFIRSNVPIAERSLLLIPHQNGNIAQGGVWQMQEENKDNMMLYQTAMAMAKNMLDKGIITVAEFNKIEAEFCKKYCINISSIFRRIAG